MVAIKDACRNLGSFQLKGCDIYTSCEPCPMCLGAMYWARPDNVYYACSQSDAAEAGFDDQFIYEELNVPLDQRKIPFVQVFPVTSKNPFKEWIEKEDRTPY
jgi:tRNA(Arg) A34 adenosine deaminase TadA